MHGRKVKCSPMHTAESYTDLQQKDVTLFKPALLVYVKYLEASESKVCLVSILSARVTPINANGR